MTAAMAIPGNTAATFLVHFFGTGLADDRYVVERYRAGAEAPEAKGRCRSIPLPPPFPRHGQDRCRRPA